MRVVQDCEIISRKRGDVFGRPDGHVQVAGEGIGTQRSRIWDAELFSEFNRAALALGLEPTAKSHLVSSGRHLGRELLGGLLDKGCQRLCRIWRNGLAVLERNLKIS